MTDPDLSTITDPDLDDRRWCGMERCADKASPAWAIVEWVDSVVTHSLGIPVGHQDLICRDCWTVARNLVAKNAPSDDPLRIVEVLP